MRRPVAAILTAALTAVAWTDSACAQSAPLEPYPETDKTEKNDKTTVGGDFLVLVPAGELRDVTRAMLGPLLRVEYRVVPALELTLRTGYLFGLPERHLAGDTNVSAIPIWPGARYFFTQHGAGLYGAAELGFNVLLPNVQRRTVTVLFEDPEDRLALRFAANAGVGYVISRDIPVDIRTQLTVLNLGETALAGSILQETYFAVGVSAGFAFRL